MYYFFIMNEVRNQINLKYKRLIVRINFSDQKNIKIWTKKPLCYRMRITSAHSYLSVPDHHLAESAHLAERAERYSVTSTESFFPPQYSAPFVLKISFFLYFSSTCPHILRILWKLHGFSIIFVIVLIIIYNTAVKPSKISNFQKMYVYQTNITSEYFNKRSTKKNIYNYAYND